MRDAHRGFRSLGFVRSNGGRLSGGLVVLDPMPVVRRLRGVLRFVGETRAVVGREGARLPVGRPFLQEVR